MKRRRSAEHQPQPQPHPLSSSRHRSGPLVSSQNSSFGPAHLPAGLFNERVSAHPYVRSHLHGHPTSRRRIPRFLLFERSPRAAALAAASALRARRPPPRPIASMLNFVQVLTAPTADTPGTCLLLHHDNRRYVFGNVAEGTQRVFVQQKMSLSRVEEIFVSGPVGWNTAGGLLGMILTVAEVVSSARAAAAELAQKPGKKKKTGPVNGEGPGDVSANRSLSIHGGRNLTQLLATARRFVFRKGLPIRPHEIRHDPAAQTGADDLRDPDWCDDNIMVWYVPVEAAGQPSEPANDDEDDRQLVDSVVQHMFDSDWSLDALVETTLHTAKLPATLFVKDDKGHLQKYTGPMPGDTTKDARGRAVPVDVPDIPVLVRQPWPGALIEALPRTQPSRQSMCYVVRNHPRRGKVNAAEAARLGVDKRDIRRLVAGESVTSTDGHTVVTPDMVVGPSVEGTGFAVIDLPDASYVDAFLARPEWSSARLLAGISTMFWILGPGLAADARLQPFMRDHPAIRHILASHDACANRLALASAASLQVQHHRIDPDRFPLQQFENTAPAVPSTQAQTQAPLPFEVARPGWAMRLAPQVVEEDGKVFPFVDFAAALREMDPAVQQLADAARARVGTSAEQAAPLLPRPDTEVIPLGTGSAMPSKYRNVSATLVRVPGVGSYLFDCGENTLGSLRRLLGADGLAEELRNLRAVWISHLHADHHLGTTSVLRAWRDVHAATDPSRRLLVAARSNMLNWLREYADIEDFGLDRLRLAELQNRGTDGGPANSYDRICVPVVFGAAEAAEFGLQRIDACLVEHCFGALATVFTWTAETDGQPPLRVAYSGDCRPSADFVTIGQDTTLLIHESTFDDELAGEAVAKKHSTMGEALQVARKMGARRLLLTHFSQRYPKIPVFGDDDDGDNSQRPDMPVLVAFDHMRVRLGDFHDAAAFLPALQKLYDGEER